MDVISYAPSPHANEAQLLVMIVDGVGEQPIVVARDSPRRTRHAGCSSSKTRWRLVDRIARIAQQARSDACSSATVADDGDRAADKRAERAYASRRIVLNSVVSIARSVASTVSRAIATVSFGSVRSQTQKVLCRRVGTFRRGAHRVWLARKILPIAPRPTARRGEVGRAAFPRRRKTPWPRRL